MTQMPTTSQIPSAVQPSGGAQGTAFPRRPCPCCAADAVTPGYRIKADFPAEEKSFEEIRRTWSHFFKSSAFFSYFRCASCGQLYCPQFFDQRQLAMLYSRMSDNSADLPLSVVGKTQRGYFDLLRRHQGLNGIYLEFGPDIGLLTEMCVREGQFQEAILIEPNLAVHAELSARTQKLPHRIFAEMDAYQQVPDGSLDTVAMIHVLDHLLEPAQILATLRRKLKRGGKILIVTHDESSLLARVLRSRWPAYCLQHPQLYNPRSISNALERAGFQVLAVQKTYNYFPVTYLFRHLLWAMRLGSVRVPNWYWFTLPLKLGNIATVATA